MKKLLYLIFLFPVFSHADEFRLPSFEGGMDSYHAANKIPDNAATYIQNFNSDTGDLATERNGYVRRDSTILGNATGSPAYGLWQFLDSSGNDWIITYSSRTFYKNTAGGTPTAFGLIATTDQIPDAAKNLGLICFVNGTDSMWCFNGTSTGTVAGAPLGKRIVAWRTRFAIGNIGSAQSTIRFSADGSSSTWTLGGLATDPFAAQIGGANDGEYIRCLTGSYLDSMIIGRKYDSWAIDGTDQSDYVIRNISQQVGCTEPRTVKEVDGELVWLSARGLEAMNGRAIRSISEPVRNITDVITKNTVSQRSNTQTSQADWAAGSFDPAIYLDTHTSPGDLQLTFPDNFDSFRDGSNNTKPLWTQFNTNVPFVLATAAFVANGNLTIVSQQSVEQFVRTRNLTTDYRAGTTYYVVLSSITPTPLPNQSDFSIYVATYFSGNLGPTSLNQYFDFQFQSTTSATISLDAILNSSDGTLCVGNSCQSNVSTVPAVIQIWMSTTNYRVTVNDKTIIAGSHTYPNGPQIPYLGYYWGLGSHTSGYAYVDTYGIAPTTATYTSQAISIGSLITAWSPTTISDSKSLATLAYQFGSTSSAAGISSIVNYTSISNGGTPTVSTNSLAAFKAVFTSTITLGTAKVSDFLTTWSEGGVTPSPVATTYDRRYWLSYTTATTSAPTLDSILVWQRNKSFSLFKGINAGAFTLWRDNLYFGNSNSTGFVYQFDVGNNDDGASITSVITTKSYDLQQFYRDKEFSKAYVGYFGGSDQSGGFSLLFNINRYGYNYYLGAANLTDEQGQNAAKFWFPLYQLVRGREIQYTLFKTGTGSRLKLYDLATQFELKEEK